jgi:hypothetical protein
MIKPRLPGLPTFSAFLLATIIVASIAITGPIPIPYKVLKDFQPLIAALVAVISAGVVLYSATLTYRAAMRKVDLDRDIHERETRRQQRGVMLRARFDVWALSESAGEIRKLTNIPMPYVLNMALVKLRGTEGLDEAWAKLEEFPGNVSRAFSAIKAEIHNYDLTRAEFGDQLEVTIAFNSKEATSAKDLADHMDQIERHCRVIFDALEQEIADR